MATYYTRSPTVALVQLISWLSLLHLPLASSQYSNDPSTNWPLSEYLAYNYTYEAYTNLTICNSESSSFIFLNEQEKGLYGMPTSIYSSHYIMPYAGYFTLYFVTAAENVCLKENGNGNNIPAYYLSVVSWNTNGRDPNQGQVIWTANPQKPVTRNSCLHLNNSYLTLVDYHDDFGSSPEVVWQTSTPSVIDASLVISAEGNLLLFGHSKNPPHLLISSWESFQSPTNTLMVLQVLENRRVLAVNSTSTANSGNYTLAFHNGRLVLYARIGQRFDAKKSPYGSQYWVWPNSSLHANDSITFVAFCWDSVNQLRLYVGSNRSSDNSTEYKGMVSPEFCSTIPRNSGAVMQITGLHQSTNATYATFLKLDSDGDLHAYTVDNTTTNAHGDNNAIWRAFYNIFNSTPCDLPLYCGFYGLCDRQKGDLDSSQYCRCDYGGMDYPKLGYVDALDHKSGCITCMAENSSVTQQWDFQNIPTEAISCPHNAPVCGSNVSDCEVGFLLVYDVDYFSLELRTRVLDIHSCKEKCKKDSCCTAAFWKETGGQCFLVLGRLGTLKKHGNMQAFIKYVTIRNNSSHVFPWKLVAGPVLAATILLACILLVYWRSRARKLSKLQREHLLLLSLLDCSNTERFTWKQMHEYTCGFSDFLGGGGFGHVFRGALPDGTAIAVKQLDEERSEGQEDKEFIAEVSINEKDKDQELLPWKTRYQIALGTAKGLAYLHEECEERVIQMDLKPQNILLDRSFLPKISDFGMSRRTAREQTSVMTVMRGTLGYLAPEWLLDCAITEKCDVYSFGIVLLELVSGRKVRDLKVVKQRLSMRPLMEGVMLDLLDESLRYGSSDVNAMEVVRMVEVALLCVRTDPTKRPGMNSVALMLEGKEEVLREFDGAEEKEEMVMYPSPMNKAMYTSFGSFTDSVSGNFSKKNYLKTDRTQSQSKPKTASLFERERSSSLSLSAESDRLLQA